MSTPLHGTPKSRALDRVNKIREALEYRSYRCIAHHPLPLGEDFSIWTDGWNTLILHTYRQGMGFELYSPLTRKNDIQAVVDAIPVGSQGGAQ